jgi:hypothetical protein
MASEFCDMTIATTDIFHTPWQHLAPSLAITYSAHQFDTPCRAVLPVTPRKHSMSLSPARHKTRGSVACRREAIILRHRSISNRHWSIRNAHNPIPCNKNAISNRHLSRLFQPRRLAIIAAPAASPLAVAGLPAVASLPAAASNRYKRRLEMNLNPSLSSKVRFLIATRKGV